MLAIATSFQQPDTLSLYNVVLFVHIAAALLAFGVAFAYPLVDAIVHRPENLRHVAWWYRTRAVIGQRLITSAATVLLLAGIYLASAGPFDFGSTFVSVGIVIVVVLLGLGGAYFAPTERKAAELAERDIAASGAGQVTLSAEYQAVAKRIRAFSTGSALLVLLAVFLMVVKPA